MQKKKITAFLLALAMVSAMALPVFAQEPNPQAETAASIAVVETATPETAATEEPKVDAEPAEDNVKEDAATYDAPPENGWYQEYPGGPWYWYENGVRQGTTGRGKEIYDPKSDAWYWLDAVQGPPIRMSIRTPTAVSGCVTMPTAIWSRAGIPTRRVLTTSIS